MSEVCIECKSYAQEALGLCGNCLVAHGKDPADYDPALVERKKIRAAELANGKLKQDDIDVAVLSARLAKLDRPERIVSSGMRYIGPKE